MHMEYKQLSQGNGRSGFPKSLKLYHEPVRHKKEIGIPSQFVTLGDYETSSRLVLHQLPRPG